MIRHLILLLTACCALFGQAASSSNSVTVTASRNANIPPDQVIFSLQVSTPVTGTLDAAVAALQGSGVTAANFTGVSNSQQYDSHGQVTQTLLVWYFSLTVALSDMKSTIALLTAVQKSNGSQNNVPSISFGVSGTAVSQQAQQAQACSQTDLLADAKAQAQKLAAAAGKGLGAVLAMSGATLTTTQSNGLLNSTVSSPACTLTVKFQLTGF